MGRRDAAPDCLSRAARLSSSSSGCPAATRPDEPRVRAAARVGRRSTRSAGVSPSIGTPLAYVVEAECSSRRLADVPLLVASDFENGGPGMRINGCVRASLAPSPGRRNRLPADDGVRRHRRRALRLRIRTDHGRGGSGDGRAPPLRAGSGRELESRQPGHRHALVRRRSRAGRAPRGGVHPREPRRAARSRPASTSPATATRPSTPTSGSRSSRPTAPASTPSSSCPSSGRSRRAWTRS